MSTVEQHQCDRQEIADFYDGTLERRLRDFVHGNERIAAAVALVDAVLPSDAARLLEVGCGLGISAQELARRRPGLAVHGVDISPKTIENARLLFAGARLRFDVSDLSAAPALAPYDAITLLDVYEHIPRDTWPTFNATLARCLAPNGLVVLTTPSPFYQEHLAAHEPAGLQIVDESVRLQDFVALAAALDGELVHFRLVSIWHRNDYCHAVIQRGPSFGELTPPRQDRTLLQRFAGFLPARFAAWRERRASAQRRRFVGARMGASSASRGTGT